MAISWPTLPCDREKPQTQPCVILENFGRELRLDQIRVQNWTTQLPVERKGEANFVVERGGQLAPGKIKSFDASSGWTIVGADGERSVAADQLMEIVQAEPPKLRTLPMNLPMLEPPMAGKSETPHPPTVRKGRTRQRHLRSKL